MPDDRTVTSAQAFDERNEEYADGERR